MAELVRANVLVHLRFFRRNRLLLVAGLIFFGFLGLSLLMTSLTSTLGGRFRTLQTLSSQLAGSVRFFVPALGLVLIWSHQKERNLKMVVTKPCTPDVWLLSGLTTAAAISAALHATVLILMVAFALAFGIPFQSGFAFLAMESFLSSLIALTYLGMLTALFHPVVALLLLAIFNDDTLQSLSMAAEVGTTSHPGSTLFAVLAYASHVLSWIPPMFHPFANRYAAVSSSLRTTPGNWLMLLASAAYATLAATLFYLVIVLALRRKPLM